MQPDGSWWVNNTGFLVGKKGVFAIDASSIERRTKALLSAIGRVTPQPVRTLVNMHHRGDHTHGSHLFADATTVGHEKCLSEILAAGLPSSVRIWTDVDWAPSNSPLLC